MLIFRTQSAEKTQELGYKIGKLLESGNVVALIGGLGTGKTCLTQGIAGGLGVTKDQYVNSPAYNIINEYKGEVPLYHIDVYRISNLSEAEELGLEEYFYGHGVTIIEWADKIMDLLPDNYLKIELYWLENENIREIRITNIGDEYTYLIEKITQI